MTEPQRQTEQKYRVNSLGVVEKVKQNDRLVKEPDTEEQKEIRVRQKQLQNQRRKDMRDDLADGYKLKKKTKPISDAKLEDEEFLRKLEEDENDPENQDKYDESENKVKPKDGDDADRYKQAIYFIVILGIFFALTNTVSKVDIYTDAFSRKTGDSDGWILPFFQVIWSIISFIFTGIYQVLATILSFLWKIITLLFGML